ncbi:flagellar hook-basal body protein [Mariniblastus sp.]|jgi:flagellar basal body rod protein FlgG|nr:flagellar hook-basal body protein [Mariniblastus sp.]
MINGIYSGATALQNYSRQQEVVSSNLAHLNTPGYRRQFLTFEENVAEVDGVVGSYPGSSIRAVSTDFEAGPKKLTDRKLDVSLAGDGFFVYQGAEAELYSRNGVLFRNPQGQLVNGDGLPVLGQGNQPIVIPPDVSDFDLYIDPSGTISKGGTTAEGGIVIGQLNVVQFDNNQLLNTGGGELDFNSQIYFKLGEATLAPAEDASVLQGYRELSNAHPVTELISLIVGSRGVESAQRAIRAISDAVKENINS